MLSTRKWAPVTSFVDGWLTLVGNWTVTLSINFSGAQLILSAITIWDEDYAATPWQTVLMFWAVMLVCALVNAFGAKYLDILNKVCIYWTSASVLIILITLLTMADNRRDAKFVFGNYDASASGWPSGWAFFVGLLQGKYSPFPNSRYLDITYLTPHTSSRLHPHRLRHGCRLLRGSAKS